VLAKGTQAMKGLGWTPKIMFEKADGFFTSIGFDPMPEVIFFKIESNRDRGPML
jgi:hypothetical protein